MHEAEFATAVARRDAGGLYVGRRRPFLSSKAPLYSHSRTLDTMPKAVSTMLTSSSPRYHPYSSQLRQAWYSKVSRGRSTFSCLYSLYLMAEETPSRQPYAGHSSLACQAFCGALVYGFRGLVNEPLKSNTQLSECSSSMGYAASTSGPQHNEHGRLRVV